MTAPPAEPFYFRSSSGDPNAKSLFGWLHLPQTNTRQLGVVICNPLGHEFICAHRSLRHFAESLANDGTAVLRFDYDGTGDSAGTDLDAERVDAWLASIHAAADTLRNVTGIERLCFLGVRFGATLAAIAASQRSDVAGLITIAPVVNGRGYIRELRALQLAMDSKEGGESETDQVLESAGFLLSKETQAGISRLDLTAVASLPAAHVLIIERTDLPANERWPTHLKTSGVQVTQNSIEGYVEMMLAPHDAIVPQNMIDTVTRWARKLRDDMPLTQNDRATDRGSLSHGMELSSTFHGRDANLIEEAVFIDKQLRMFAIMSRPTANTPATDAQQVIVMLNSGAVHRIGPNRVYVTLARNWAARGHVVLRVDISGIGDSPARPGEPENSVYSARAQEDVMAILRFVAQHYGAANCHAVGICSGAYHSFKAAVQGAPIKSAIMINPLTFFWKAGMSLQYPAYRVAADVERYKTSMFRMQSWFKLLRGHVNLVELSQVLLRQGTTVVTRMLRELAHAMHFYFADDLGRELEIVAGRSVDMMFVFSAQDPGLQVLLQQGGATVGRLRRKSKLDIELIELANHTFTSLQAREKLVSLLTSKLERT